MKDTTDLNVIMIFSNLININWKDNVLIVMELKQTKYLINCLKESGQIS